MVSQIFRIKWVTPDNFDIDRISFHSEVIPKTMRVKVLYRYDDDDQSSEFHITLPRKKEAYVLVDAFKQDMFKKGTSNNEPGKHSTSCLLAVNNTYHDDLFSVFQKIAKKFGKQYDVKCKFPFKASDSGARIFVGLIQNSSQDIFTPFYTSEEQIEDIVHYGSFIGRPAFCLSGNTETGKMVVQMVQAYVHEQVKNFPLAYYD